MRSAFFLFATFRNFTISRNFQQFSASWGHSFNCFRPVHFACLLVPFAFMNNCCRTICFNVFLPPKKSELCFNFMVILRAACRCNPVSSG